MIQTALAAGTALAATAALIAWLHRHLLVIDVSGPSMEPTLYGGDRVLVRRRTLRHVRAGDIVVARSAGHLQSSPSPGTTARASRHPAGHAWMIKRVAAVPGDPVPASLAATLSTTPGTPVPDGRMLVLGDNTRVSTDSRYFGYVSGDGVLGVVVRHLRPRDEASGRAR
ncbi:S26 family signal peptidase [Actinomadura livida]|uniref:signal peptidase I n=1 Tax=Actinomadura livida TaxID=79909 RepID=A0A7W7IHG9_9ACTN|nr:MULTISPECIES: S26 family signal peptidase [Actinomadura]MBB4777197.1 signal peptidase I [Actinomadura catellatispora]GGU20951.1 S26 family signal peptidase [Actinomadura livida]